jgi:hypothetical protein
MAGALGKSVLCAPRVLLVMLKLRSVLVTAASITPGAATLALVSDEEYPCARGKPHTGTHPTAINKVFACADRPGRGKSEATAGV